MSSLRDELLSKYNVKPAAATPTATPGTKTDTKKTPTLRDEILSKYLNNDKPAAPAAPSKPIDVPPELMKVPGVPSSFATSTPSIIKPEQVDKGTKALGDLAQSFKEAPGGLLNQMAKTIRATTQLLATPIAGLLGLGERVTPETTNKTNFDTKSSTPGIVDTHGESTLAIPAMKESLLMAKNMLLDEKVQPSDAIDEAGQMYLKARGIGKYGGKDPGIADVAMLGFLKFSDLFGDPAFEFTAGLKGMRALQEFATFKKVGSVTKDLSEIIPGLAREAKIVKPIDRTFELTKDLKIKVKPREGEVVFEGYARRFGGSKNPASGFIEEGAKAAEGAKPGAASPSVAEVKDLMTKMSEGAPMDVDVFVRGDDLVMKPQFSEKTLQGALGAARSGETVKGSSDGVNASPNAELVAQAEDLAQEPISSSLLSKIKALNPEESAAFGRKIVDDLSSKLGIDLNDADVRLPEDTFIKTTPSADGRPAQINQNNQIEIFLPNLVKDIQTLASGKTILAHEGAFSQVYKMKEGESMSELATRYITDVVVHERAHLKTMTAADESTRRQLQQKVYEAQASKNANAVTEAKTNMENFMRELEDRANAYVKTNRAELESEVFAGKRIDTSDLTRKPGARGGNTKSMINKSTGIRKPSEKVTVNESQQLKKKLAAEQRASREGARAGRAEAERIVTAQNKNLVGNERARAVREVELKLFKQRVQDRARAQKEVGKTKSRYEEAIEKIKDKNASIADKRKELIEFAELLPQKSRAKFIRSINGLKTDKQFEEIINRIAKESNLVERGGLIKDISAELKGTVIKNKNKFPNPKFEYEAQKTLNRIRANVNGNYAEAQTKIAELIADFQTKNPDAFIPDELVREIQLLKMVGIKDMTAKELRAVLQDVKNIKETGRTAKELDRANKEAEVERTRDKITEVITGNRELPSDKISLNKSEGVRPRGKSGDLIQSAKEFLTTGQYGLEEVLDSLSQFDKNSKPYESFLSREVGGKVNKAFNIQNQGEIVQISKMNNIVKETYGLTKNKDILQLYEDLTKPVDLGMIRHTDGVKRKLEISRDQAIKKYMEFQDPTLDETFETGLMWGDEVKDAVKSILKPEDIKFAEAQLDFYREYYEGVNDVFVKEFGVDLPFNEFYSPIAREVDVAIPESVILAQEAAKYASAKNASLKNRVKSNLEVKGTGSLETLMRHIVKMEHYKAWSEPMSTLRKVFSDKVVRQSIVDFHGKNYLQIVDNFLNDFARDGVSREKIIPIIDKLRANVTRALLGLNPNVAYKQITGVLNYAIELPLDDFAKGIADYWTAPLEKSRFLYNNSAALQERFGEGFERDIKFAIKRNVGRQIANTRDFGEFMFSLIRNADKFTVFQGSWASFASKYQDLTGQAFDMKNYDKAAAQQAIEYAETITGRVQETSRLDTMSPIQRGGSIAKLFTMFQSQPSKYYRVIINAARNYRAGRGSKAENIKRIIMAWFVVPMIYQFVADKFEFDAKKQAKVAILGPLSYPLITGQIFQSAFGWVAGEPFKYQPSAVFSFMDDLQNGINSVKTDDAVKAVTYMADSIGKLTGVPTGIVTRPVRNALKKEKDSEKDSGGGVKVTF